MTLLLCLLIALPTALVVGLRVTLALGQAFAALRTVAWAKRSCRALGSGGIPASISRRTTKAAGTSRGLGALDGSSAGPYLKDS